MRGLFCRKAVQSRSLILGFSFLVLVQLTTLGEHLSNSIHGGNNYFSSINHIHHHHLSLLTLCSRRVKQSQTVRSGRFESNLLTWPGRPKHTSRGYSQSHTCNISPFFPGCGSGPPTSTTRIHATVRRRVVSLLAPACGRMRTTFKDGGEYVPASVQSSI